MVNFAPQNFEKQMKKIILLTAVIFTLISCKNGAVDSCKTDSFNRKALLENWADNIIIPAYENYVSELELLDAKAIDFVATPNQTNLTNLKTAWINAYKAWQKVSAFEVGKAEELKMRDFTNTYPSDIAKIEANITAKDYNLTLSTKLNQQGFPALDYLLNGLGKTAATAPASDSEILVYYTSPTSLYKSYLTAVTSRLKTMGTSVLTDWKTSYRNTFVANDCSSSTASFDIVTNDFIFNFEKHIRFAKVGDPSGYLSGISAPEKVEALYNKTASKELLVVALQASIDFFNGKHFNSTTEGQSLKSYLNELNIEAGGGQLSVMINQNLEESKNIANNLEGNFYDLIVNNRTDLNPLREKLHSVVDVFKTNMLSAFKVKADYNDSDGD